MTNTANMVDDMIAKWKMEGLSKSELAVKIAQACMGWPYIFGDRGQYCTSSHRQAVYNAHPDQTGLLTKCQKLSKGKDSCIGCQYFPGGQTRSFDCRGFTYWVLSFCGIKIMGAGATSQWNDNNNWKEKGEIGDIPLNQVCCVFKRSDNKMQHTGLHIGGGKIIHCSNGVQTGKITDRGWTHYAIPVGMDGTVDPDPGDLRPTIRKGSVGEYVVECQNDLIKLGYDVGKTGADGKFGKNTEYAVKVFQSEHDLEIDGIVGPKTWKALDEAVRAISPEPPAELRYEVHIPHMTDAQADALITQYPGAYKTEEKG